MGKLSVTVLGCRDLESKDTFGSSDPYVKLTAGGKTFKTKVIKNNVNPNFNEQFTFYIADPNMEQLRIEVMDSDTFSDDTIGVYSLSLAMLHRGVKKEDWYLLQAPAKKGKVGLVLLAEDFGQIPQQQVPTAGTVPQQPQQVVQGAPPQQPQQVVYVQQQAPPPGFPQQAPAGFPQAPPPGFPGYAPPPGFPQQAPVFQGYGQPGYPAPQPGYPAPQPGYPAPQPGYPAPQPGYPAPQPGYPAPQPGYPAPQPGYPAPQPGYPAPQPGYPAPQPGYPAPQPGYPAPQPGYPAPQQPGYPGYPPPQNQYQNPFGGVGGVQYY